MRNGHDEPCLICGELCSSFSGNPGLWPLRLGNNGWHHTGCVNNKLREVKATRNALFVLDNFTSHSDLPLSWKINCDSLTDVDLDTLARLYASRQQYSEVHSVPSGGNRFAEALRQYRHPTSSFILIAYDVLTTGASIAELRNDWIEQIRWKILGVVIFARGPCPDWVRPIFTLEPWMQP